MWLHGHSCWVSLCWLVTNILLELVGRSLALTLHARTTYLLCLAHASSHTLVGPSSPCSLLLARHSSGWNLTDASGTWNLSCSWHSLHPRLSHLLLWLHWLPSRAYLLHLWWKEGALPSLWWEKKKKEKTFALASFLSLNQSLPTLIF